MITFPPTPREIHQRRLRWLLWGLTIACTLLGAALACAGPREVVRRACVRLEILDEREQAYYFHHIEYYWDDLRILTQRWLDLQYAPPLSDAQRFPSSLDTQDLVDFNWVYVNHLECAVELTCDPVEQQRINNAKSEALELRAVYSALQDAANKEWYVTMRRYALKKLRDELLGPANYAAGILPPHVPFWRFEEIK